MPGDQGGRAAGVQVSAMPELLSSIRLFEGWQRRYRHYSHVLGCSMHFSVYLPPAVSDGGKRVPVVYWLSGLTCTDENFSLKAGAQRVAAEAGLILVIPDTSPRGEGVPDAPDAAYDLGLGAGFYVNATQAPWNRHYRMYDYIVDELPALVEQAFPADSRRSVCGHSMGGHGALVIALRNPDRYRSVSAFSPIVNPVNSPWGKKVFSHYLGDNTEDWCAWDATLLVAAAGTSRNYLPVLIDQGDADEFLQTQLQTEQFIAACKVAHYPVQVNMRVGYDHSYYFVSTFIEDHLRFHSSVLYGCV